MSRCGAKFHKKERNNTISNNRQSEFRLLFDGPKRIRCTIINADLVTLYTLSKEGVTTTKKLTSMQDKRGYIVPFYVSESERSLKFFFAVSKKKSKRLGKAKQHYATTLRAFGNSSKSLGFIQPRETEEIATLSISQQSKSVLGSSDMWLGILKGERKAFGLTETDIITVNHPEESSTIWFVRISELMIEQMKSWLISSKSGELFLDAEWDPKSMFETKKKIKNNQKATGIIGLDSVTVDEMTQKIHSPKSKYSPRSLRLGARERRWLSKELHIFENISKKLKNGVDESKYSEQLVHSLNPILGLDQTEKSTSKETGVIGDKIVSEFLDKRGVGEPSRNESRTYSLFFEPSKELNDQERPSDPIFGFGYATVAIERLLESKNSTTK